MKIHSIVKSTVAAAILLVTTSGIANAQNSKNVSVKNFNKIAVSSGIDLYLTQGAAESLNIKADEELLKNVEVIQDGQKVTIKYKDGISWSRMFKSATIKVYVSYKSLNELTASGGSDVYTQNTLKADALTLRASGGADLKLSLAVKDLTLGISGGSDADLKGSGENLNATASGGSDLNAFGYVVNYAKVSVSGGSDAHLFVNKGLEAGASGGSDVNYKGSASLKRTTSSKSGDINHVN